MPPPTPPPIVLGRHGKADEPPKGTPQEKEAGHDVHSSDDEGASSGEVHRSANGEGHPVGGPDRCGLGAAGAGGGLGDTAGPRWHDDAPPIVVTFNGDQGDLDPNDGVCDFSTATSQDCTLRAAIEEANARTGPDEIDFLVRNAFRDPATGVVTFTPQSALPVITGRVTINGYSQPGAHPNTLAKGTD